MNFANQFLNQPYETAVKDDPFTGLTQVRVFLSRQWRLIAVITGLSIVLGVLYIVTSPTKYTAQADMIIDTKKVTWTQSELSTEKLSVEDASVESEIETTKSETVALAVIKRLHLTEDPEFTGASHSILSRIFTLFRSPPSPDPSKPAVLNDELMRQALGVFKNNLKVLRLGHSYIEQI